MYLLIVGLVVVFVVDDVCWSGFVCKWDKLLFVVIGGGECCDLVFVGLCVLFVDSVWFEDFVFVYDVVCFCVCYKDIIRLIECCCGIDGGLFGVLLWDILKWVDEVG